MRPVGFSRSGCSFGGRLRSSRTGTRRLERPGVALPAGARQRRSRAIQKVSGKVSVSISVPAPLQSRERTFRQRPRCRGACLFWLAARLPCWSSNVADCSQCVQAAAGTVDGAVHYAPRTLAVKWLRPTRLETRTKESNMCASLRVTETRRHNESESASAPR